MNRSNPPDTRTWLVMAHCFNMDGRAASQTLTDRLGHLRAAGVQPVVVSAPTGDRHPAVAHHRVLSPAPSGLLFEGRQLVDRGGGRRPTRAASKALLTAVLLPVYLVEKLVADLDSQWSWFMSAAVLGLVLVRRRRPALVYSSAGPPSSHLAAWLVSRLARRPWLAEVHDPLVYGDGRPRRVRDLFQLLVETAIFRDADAVVYFTRAALDDARRRHPPRRRAVVLRPGAHPPDIGGVGYRRRERVHFGHFGSLDRHRHLGPVVRAIHRLIEAHPEWRDRLRLDVYGSRLDDATREALARRPLGDLLAAHGRLEFDSASGKSGRRRVMEAMRRTDVLLLIHGEGDEARYYVPSKLYEYLLMRRPILCLAAPDTELARMLVPLGHRVVDPRRDGDVAQAMAEMIVSWQAGGLADRPAAEVYRVSDAVAALVALADEIAGRGAGRTGGEVA